MKTKYMIIEESGMEMIAVQETFSSIAAARKWIERDAEDTCEGLPANELENPEQWGNTLYICEVKQTVKPVPRVKVSVKIELMEIEQC